MTAEAPATGVLRVGRAGTSSPEARAPLAEAGPAAGTAGDSGARGLELRRAGGWSRGLHARAIVVWLAGCAPIAEDGLLVPDTDLGVIDTDLPVDPPRPPLDPDLEGHPRLVADRKSVV